MPGAVFGGCAGFVRSFRKEGPGLACGCDAGSRMEINRGKKLGVFAILIVLNFVLKPL
jgi:hypothetical protein